jgi:hypothetical protein
MGVGGINATGCGARRIHRVNKVGWIYPAVSAADADFGIVDIKFKNSYNFLNFS